MFDPFMAKTMIEYNRDDVARSRGYRSWKHMLRDLHARTRR